MSTITVGGNVSSTSIAAGIAPGADGLFGTADDTSGAATTTGTGIGSITISGSLSGSGNPAAQFGIVAHKGISALRVAGKAYTIPAAPGSLLFGNVKVAKNWK